MNKLIKVFENFYIINDDAIVDGDWISYPTLKEWVPVQYFGDLIGTEKKITHSTENLDGIITLCLPEIIELICSYNKNKLYTVDNIKTAIRYGFDVGFCSNSLNKVKNRLQTEEDFIKNIVPKTTSISTENLSSLQELVDEGYDPYDSAHHLQVQRILKVIENFIESVTPKTVWNISIDENNKITML